MIDDCEHDLVTVRDIDLPEYCWYMRCRKCGAECNDPAELEECGVKIGMCGRCYDDGVEIHPANCDEKPEELAGQPIGQYHCPDCGAMVVAGVPHQKMCWLCIERKHPEFDDD